MTAMELFRKLFMIAPNQLDDIDVVIMIYKEHVGLEAKLAAFIGNDENKVTD